jgi:hypothetical protein
VIIVVSSPSRVDDSNDLGKFLRVGQIHEGFRSWYCKRSAYLAYNECRFDYTCMIRS